MALSATEEKAMEEQPEDDELTARRKNRANQKQMQILQNQIEMVIEEIVPQTKK